MVHAALVHDECDADSMHQRPAASTPEHDAIADLRERYLAAQLVGDRRAALSVLVDEGLGKRVAVPTLYLDVVQAAQYRIGELWQNNRVTVAQEHLATAISQLALAELYRALPREPLHGRRAIVACVGGELHDLGTRTTADFFEMAGFEVRYLGASMPTDSLVAMVREDPIDLLVLSATMSFHLDTLRKAVYRTREAAGDRLRFAVGGQAFTWGPSLAERLGAEIYGRDAPESVAHARRVFHLDEG
jgi:MerR family transcriptional regulator, light-induced transcriptional regulator